MYGSIPYMMPNMGMQAAAPIASNLMGTTATANAASTGASIFSKINWSSLLSNAQKTLNVVNQAIPLYYQVKPVFKNIRTLGRIGKEFTKLGNSYVTSNANSVPSSANLEEKNTSSETVEDIPNPTFYL